MMAIVAPSPAPAPQLPPVDVPVLPPELLSPPAAEPLPPSPPLPQQPLTEAPVTEQPQEARAGRGSCGGVRSGAAGVAARAVGRSSPFPALTACPAALTPLRQEPQIYGKPKKVVDDYGGWRWRGQCQLGGG